MSKVIKLVYYTEILDNMGRRESTMKGPIIFSVLNNVDEWNDDMLFEDDKGNLYSIDDLAGKSVELVDVGIFEVPVD